MTDEKQVSEQPESVEMAMDEPASAESEGATPEKGQAPGAQASEAAETGEPESGPAAEPGDAGNPNDPPTATAAELEAARGEVKEYHERLLRVSADFENYKKRSAREMESHRKYANENLIKALLPVVDNLELALQSAGACKAGENGSAEKPPGSAPGIVEGVEMTLKELLKVLEKFGVVPIDSVGKPFDPGFHEAAMQEPSDQHPDNSVIREFQRGYMIQDRLLRPAMVVVAKGGGGSQ